MCIVHVFETTSKWGDIPLNVLTPNPHPPKFVSVYKVPKERERERERDIDFKKL